jgi:hypothetical protein
MLTLLQVDYKFNCKCEIASGRRRKGTIPYVRANSPFSVSWTECSVDKQCAEWDGHCGGTRSVSVLARASPSTIAMMWPSGDQPIMTGPCARPRASTNALCVG